MIQAWKIYQAKLLREWFRPKLAPVEVLVVSTVLAALTLCAIDASIGYDIGSPEKLRLVKIKAQQDLMALQTHP